MFLENKKTKRKKEKKQMKNVAGTIQDVSSAVVAVIKGLVVAFIFVGILYDLPAGVDPIGCIKNLVSAFLDGGLGGLLALLVFASFIK